MGVRYRRHIKPSLSNIEPASAQIVACRGPRLVLGRMGELSIFLIDHGWSRIVATSTQSGR